MDCGKHRLSGIWLLSIALTVTTHASELREGTLQSDMVPGTVGYGVVLPDGYDTQTDPYPLLLLLHGGGQSHEQLDSWKESLDKLWESGELPKLVAAMPSSGKPTIEGRVRYMDFQDASEKWESFVMGPFLKHIRNQYNVAEERGGTFIAGFSDGGFTTLRLGFKHPGKFAGLAAFEPAIMPALEWKDVRQRNGFFISPELIARFYGDPVDEDYWAANNPAAIAKASAEKIRESGLEIYLECGNEDYLNLAEGTEFLHQILWNCNIPHEYHLVRGANHLGRTIGPRTAEGLKFISRVLDPPGPEPAVKPMEQVFGDLKAQGEKVSPRRFWSEQHLD